MRKTFVALLGILAMLGIALVAQPAQAEGDSPQVCNWVVSTYGTNNGHTVFDNAVHQIKADYSIQLRRAPGCTTQLRGKMNIRVYQWGQPTNGRANGTIDYFIDLQEQFTNGTGPDYTGPDGIMTHYVGWYNAPDGFQQVKGWFQSVEVGSNNYDITNGYRGGSHDCFLDASDVMVC